MSFAEQQPEVPTWFAGLVIVLFATSLFYGIVIMQSLFAPLMLWLGILSFALSLFVVYLLYRFVLAVEKIAEKI